ncbi:phosphatase PAP2 family protein [Streptomyces sp. B1866]|uniref:phosphatase PAP2 family protein n=1 Tax=Streptomyces sp. B1866 TaxID=3075431 RepID=UPI00288E4252|nr:phosphatase PAP2 family protein [Streptomyces sp. B1866]MDT3400394.1 phosphatase PAP2 family protein [Streptomyces sp. B1866]
MPQTVPSTGSSRAVRPRWWAELPLIAVLYAAYSAGRLLARGDVTTAVDHGLALLRLEQRLDIDFETPLNNLFTHHAVIGVPADFAYASLHYVVTPLVLVWLWFRRLGEYRFLRTWLLISTILGLVGFTLAPTCPPRLLDAGHGFVDTMAQYASYGWWGGEASAPRGLGGLTNQYAAMPSLHVGWALWCGVALWRYGRTTWTKALGVLYPLTIVLVVMGTANHYFLDALAGAATMGVGLLLTRPALRLADRLRERAGRARAEAQAPVAVPAARTGEADGGPSGSGAPVTVSGGGDTVTRDHDLIPHQRGDKADTADEPRGGAGPAGGAAGPESGPGTGQGADAPAAAGDGTAAAAR